MFKNLLFWDFPGSPVVKTRASSAGGMGLIPGGGTKIPHAAWHGQKKKNKTPFILTFFVGAALKPCCLPVVGFILS